MEGPQLLTLSLKYWEVVYSHLGVCKDKENPKNKKCTHLEGLKEGIDGLVSQNLGNHGVASHSRYKLSLCQLIVLVPEIDIDQL